MHHGYKLHFLLLTVSILLNNTLIGYRVIVKHLSYTFYINAKKLGNCSASIINLTKREKEIRFLKTIYNPRYF